MTSRTELTRHERTDYRCESAAKEMKTINNSKASLSEALYFSPFSLSYWRSAAAEVKNLRMIVFAAIIIAARVVLKTIYIPVGDGLNIYIGFLLNAMGSTVYGPIIALMVGAIGDIVGFFIAPSGAFLPVFTLIEMLGSLIYALVLYKSKINAFRLGLSKLLVNLFVNILGNSFALASLYGKGVYYYLLPRITKNLLLLPLEIILLILFFNSMIPVLVNLRVMTQKQNRIKLSYGAVTFISIVMVLLAFVIIWFYSVLKK